LRFLHAFYLTPRLFQVLVGLVLLFVLGYFLPVLDGVGRALLAGLVAAAVLDAWLLFRVKDGVEAGRSMPERLSNGDENPITINLTNGYAYALRATVLDELPFQFQIRDARHVVEIPAGGARQVSYSVRPVARGAYSFGALNVYASSPIGLVSRRYRFEVGRSVPVYPSYLQMRKYELLAVSNRLEEAGVKRIRRIGHTMEFDQIREYVVGDDYRTVNWKATARRGGLMVNQFQDERSQPVYCLLDMGRVMKMPFEGMTLLDHSINAALVFANIALLKQDRAGLVAFSKEITAALPALRQRAQIYRMQETLYNLRTDFYESDYARLVAHLRRYVRRRSLLILFTNFETRSSLERQLPSLRALAGSHVLVVVFFENTELRGLLEAPVRDVEGVYLQTIAEKFAFEKREIVKELARYGIHAVLTPPADLSINTINKYLELKARGMI